MRFRTPLLLAGLLAGLTLSLSLHAQDRIRWKLAMTWGPNAAPLSTTVEKMADLVADMSEGNFTIRVDPASRHKSPFGIFDFVKMGQYEMGHTASYYYIGKDMAFQPFTTMPFGMTVPEQYGWFYHGGGLELMAEVYEPEGLLAFPGGNTGNQMGGWFREEIESLEDLQGLRMRVPGFAGRVLSGLGVNVTNIPPGELYTALNTGTIDAAEWVGPDMDFRMGFPEIADYYYTGWHEPASEVQFLVNAEAFAELPREYQAILQTAIRLAAFDMYVRAYHRNADAWRRMAEEHPNVEVRTFPGPVLAELRAETARLVEEEKARNPLFARIVESKEAYLEKARDWTRMSDYLYLQDNLEE